MGVGMEIRDYLRAVRRHGIAIILLVIVGLGASYGWAAIQTPVYQAEASGFLKVRDTETPEGMQIAPASTDSFARSKVDTFLDMATWRTVAEFAAEELKIDAPPEDLVRRIEVSNPEGTPILKITAQGSTPDAARDLASAWVNGLINTIDTADGDGTPGSAPVTVVLGESASLPTVPSFPDTRTAVLIGGLLGLGAGIAFAIMRALSDRRVRPGDEVQERLGLSVLGSIPVVSGAAAADRMIDLKATDSKGGFAVTEALRTLRTNLQFMAVDDPPRRIVVTSAMPGEGKSTVAANLAAVLAANGENVALIDGDLRRPTVADTMGLMPGAGLTDVLAGRADLVDVLQRSPGIPGLVVLGAGTVPPNPSELLGSTRMRKLLDELAAHAIVIIDAPPLLPVTDGAILAHQADGAILVVSVGRTTYDLVEKSIDALDKVQGTVLGVVLNRAPLSGAGATNYANDYRTHDGDQRAKPVTPTADGTGPRRTEPSWDTTEPGATLESATAPASGRKTAHRRARETGDSLSDLVPPDDDALLEQLFGETATATKRPAAVRRGTQT